MLLKRYMGSFFCTYVNNLQSFFKAAVSCIEIKLNAALPL